MASIALLISLFPALSHTQNVTSEHPSAEKVGWVSSPEGRGTSDILWSCFGIFLVYTWKCTHLNLPSARKSEAGWHATANGWSPYWPTRHYWTVVLRKVKWMCIVALASEASVICAARDFWRARSLRNKGILQGLNRPDGPNDGGGLIRQAPVERKRVLGAQSMPPYYDEDLANQSNSDLPTKAFAVLQCAWLLTVLELTTLAFIVCAAFMYAFWCYKPFDSQTLIILRCQNPQIVTHIRESLKPWRKDTRHKNRLLFHATAIVFSGIHLIAWNWDIPSRTLSKLYGGALFFGVHIICRAMPPSVCESPNWNNIFPHFS
ncbi:hypothetical protein BJX65DRAFT_293953 [Aspergillus insuetus]